MYMCPSSVLLCRCHAFVCVLTAVAHVLRSSGIVVILSSSSEEDNADAGEETLDILAGSTDEVTSAELLPASGRKRRLLEDAADGGTAGGVAPVEARGPSRRKAKAPKRAQTEAELAAVAEPAAADAEPEVETIEEAAGPASAFGRPEDQSRRQWADGAPWLRLSAAALAPKPQPNSAAVRADASERREPLEAPVSPAGAPEQNLPAERAPALAPVASAPTPLPSSQPAKAPAAASETFKQPPPKPAPAALDHAASAPAADASASLAAACARSQSAAGPSLASWLGSRPPRAAAPVQGQLRETGARKAQEGASAASGAGVAGKRKGQGAAVPAAKKKAKQAKKAQIGGGTVKEDVARRENAMRVLAKQFAAEAGALGESSDMRHGVMLLVGVKSKLDALKDHWCYLVHTCLMTMS